jgi:antitoxin VapB
MQMALSIKDPETDRLARQLAKATGKSITEAVNDALRDQLERVSRRTKKRRLADELDEIALECAALPILDRRSEDEILGYDEHGLPS